MPNITCPSPQNLCEDPSRPVTNYSSEAVDRERFFGRSYNPKIPPPLGPIFQSTGCVGTCTSEVSQEDADQCAARQAVLCINDENPSTNPDNPPGPSIPTVTYFNDEQSFTFLCEDGQGFTFTVPAGTVAANSLAAANASALSMAENGAINNRICLGELTPAFACADASYSGTIDILCPKAGVPDYTIEVTIVGGALPDGVTMTENDDDITISGTPTLLGDSTFTLFAQLIKDGGQVSSVLKSFTLSVLGVVQSILPEATQGNAYSEAFTITGTTTGTVTWALTGGALPAGLTLNTDGTVTGTPSVDGSFNLTVSFTDDNVTCSKDVTLEVAPGVPYQELVWTQVALVQVGTGTATFFPANGGTGADFSALCTCNDVVSQGRATYDADITYAGPNMAGIVTMTIVNNEVIADPGINTLQVSYFLNAALQTSVNMPQGYSGPLTLPFTAMAGAMKFRVDVLSNAGVNLSISVVGSISNV